MLEINHLSYAYRKKENEVLKDLSLTLPEGEIGVLLGPNGAGKSTLLKVMGGIYKPESGSIYYQGEDISSLKEKERARRIAYVPQNISLSSLSVYDSVLLGRLPYLGFKASKEDEKIVQNVLEELDLSSFALRNADDLSGGERQKVLIARALVQEASLLLLDEPTSALDISNQVQILSLIKKLVKEKHLTALFALHDINLALKIGDRFYFLTDGRISLEGGKEIITEENIETVYSVKVKILEEDGEKALAYRGI